MLAVCFPFPPLGGGVGLLEAFDPVDTPRLSPPPSASGPASPVPPPQRQRRRCVAGIGAGGDRAAIPQLLRWVGRGHGPLRIQRRGGRRAAGGPPPAGASLSGGKYWFGSALVQPEVIEGIGQSLIPIVFSVLFRCVLETFFFTNKTQSKRTIHFWPLLPLVAIFTHFLATLRPFQGSFCCFDFLIEMG